MRASSALLLTTLALCAGCAPSPPPPPAAAPAAAVEPDPRDPRVRAQAVEQATLDAKRRQDEALEKQGG